MGLDIWGVGFWREEKNSLWLSSLVSKKITFEFQFRFRKSAVLPALSSSPCPEILQVHSPGLCTIPSAYHQPLEELETQTWKNGRKQPTHKNRDCGHLWVGSWGKEVWLGSPDLGHTDLISSQQQVKQWSLAPIQCQQESPVWGAVRKETLFSANSSVMIQFTWVLWYSIAAEQHNWESTAVR